MTWSRDEIQARIDELDQRVGWYQDINFGDGLHTKSRVLWGETIDHPRQRWEHVAKAVPNDLSGLSVLDIGCNAGYIALQAKQRGAEHVLGVDLKPGYIEQARFSAEVMGLDVEFRELDIYDLHTLGRQFDLVFCVGILYHCKYLSLAVDRVSDTAREALIVESAIDPMDSEIPYVRFIRSSQYAGPRAEGSQRMPGHWHPNMVALEDMFYERGFRKIDRIFKEGGRGAIAAYR